MIHDLRQAVRSLLRSPGFSAIAVLVLALGIGANTAIFSVVDAVLLRPLPFPGSERLMALWERDLTSEETRNPTSPANFTAWREETDSFAALGAYVDVPAVLSASGGEPEPVRVRWATSSLTAALGISPVAGRLFTPEDAHPETARVALLTHDLWRERFGGSSEVLGRTIRIDREPFVVAGILPRGARLPSAHADLWLAYPEDEEFRSWGGRFLTVIGRLRPGASEAAADAELATIAARRAQALPELNAGMTAHAVPLRQDLVGDVRPALLVLLGAVGFLLLVACANVANLLLVRAAGRRRELAVRTALGASRVRLSRQLLAESLVLAVLAGVAGVALAAWLAATLRGLVPTDLAVPRLDEAGLDLRVLAFTATVTLVTALAFGWLPGLAATRDLRGALAGERAVSVGRAEGRLRWGLVAAQVALVLMLLAGAGLMLRSFDKLARVDLGFRPDNVLTAQVSLPGAGPPDEEAQLAFFERLEERLRSLPGVRSVGAVSFLPLSGERSATYLVIEGRPRPPQGQEPTGDVRAVTPGYLRTMGIPLLEGRGILPTDRPDTPKVAVVGESLARAFFPGESPIGKRIAYWWGEDVWVEIVGVAADVRDAGPALDPYLEVYMPLAQFPYGTMSVVLRTAGDPAALAGTVRREVRQLDPELAVTSARPMSGLVRDAFGRSRLSTVLLSGFGALGLLLAVIGIYGVVSYGVALRTREIGLRAALGAERADLVGLVLRQGLGMALLGISIGLAGALAGTRALSSLLYGVAPTDPVTLAAAAAALVLATLAACALPAWRAARLDPVDALRQT